MISSAFSQERCGTGGFWTCSGNAACAVDAAQGRVLALRQLAQHDSEALVVARGCSLRIQLLQRGRDSLKCWCEGRLRLMDCCSGGVAHRRPHGSREPFSELRHGRTHGGQEHLGLRLFVPVDGDERSRSGSSGSLIGVRVVGRRLRRRRCWVQCGRCLRGLFCRRDGGAAWGRCSSRLAVQRRNGCGG